MNVTYIDGNGAARSSPADCRYGVSHVIVADTVYWPLSADDAQRLHSAACGMGEFAAHAVQGEPVDLDRYDAGLLGGQDGMPAYVWHDIIRAELDRAYDFYKDQLDRAAPQPAEQQPAPDASALVEAAEAALEEIENIMHEAYNSAYPVCCGRAGSECCGSPDPEWDEAGQRMMDRLAPHQKALNSALAAHHIKEIGNA